MATLDAILAATDFSTDGRYAAERAARLCNEVEGRRGSVLHVLAPLWQERIQRFVGISLDVDEPRLAAARTSLNELLEALRSPSGSPLEPQIRTGNVIDTILKVASDYDVIVLGARGEHPMRDFAVGTTAERLLRRTTRPILTVRRAATTVYRRALVAVDYSIHSPTTLATANLVAPSSELYVCHVNQAFSEREMRFAGVDSNIIAEYRMKARTEATTAMDRLLRESRIPRRRLHPWIDEGEHIPSTLLEKSREIDADLVVVSRHGQSLAEDLLIGSVTLHVLGQSECDVLVAR